MIQPHSPASLHDEGKFDDLVKEGRHATLDNTIWRKLDKWILPLCTCFLFSSSVDRTNIANARLAGLQKSLHMSNYQYTMVLTLTYISYTAAQFPSSLLLKYIGPNILLPALAASWGVVSASQGLVDSYAGLSTCRFFLGLLEGGLPSGVLLYLSSFYPRRMLQTRVTVYFSVASLSGAFSGLLAAAIDHLDGKGGKPGWAWIFILEGAISFVYGVVCFFLLPCSPEKARFLKENEREYVVCNLKHAGSVSEDESLDRFSWTEVARALKSPHLWLLTIIIFFNGATQMGLAVFEPEIVASLGYSGNRAQLMSVPPFAVAFVLAFPSAFISDHYQCRGFIVIFFSLWQVIGFTMFYLSTSSHVRYASLFFSVTGSFCTAPAMNTWVANNSAPHVRRATTVAIAFTSIELGGILATWLLGWLSPAPDYTSATIAFIAMSIGMVLFAAVNLEYLRRENRKKAEVRQRMNKEDEPKGLGDRSAWFIYSL